MNEPELLQAVKLLESSELREATDLLLGRVFGEEIEAVVAKAGEGTLRACLAHVAYLLHDARTAPAQDETMNTTVSVTYQEWQRTVIGMLVMASASGKGIDVFSVIERSKSSVAPSLDS